MEDSDEQFDFSDTEEGYARRRLYQRVEEQITEDMKELRRIGDPNRRDFLRRTLIGQLFGQDATSLKNGLMEINGYELASGNKRGTDRYADDSQRRKVVDEIFVAGSPDDLKAKRRRVAEELDVSERTIVRQEDFFINAVGNITASRVGEDESLRAVVASWFEARQRTALPVTVSGSDLTSLVEDQAEALATMKVWVDSLTYQVGEMVKANKKMAKMLGK